MGNYLSTSSDPRLSCSHTFNAAPRKHCQVEDQKVTQSIFEFQRMAKEGYEKIVFEHCELIVYPSPQSLLMHIPNLRHISINDSKIPQITKNDLKGFKFLKSLTITCCNDLESLPGDLFENTPIIERLDFSSNKICYVGNNVLDPLKFLVYFDLSDNPGINAIYNSEDKTGKLSLVNFRKAIKACKSGSEKYCRGLECKCCQHAEEVMQWKLKCDELEKKYNEKLEETKSWEEKFKALEEKSKETHDWEEMIKSFEEKSKEVKDWEEKFKALKEKLKEAHDLEEKFKALSGKFNALEIEAGKSKNISTSEVMDTSNKIREEEEKAKDFIIKTSSKDFKVNKVIVIAKSVTIAKLIKETPETDSITLDNISDSIVEEIVAYIQNGKLPGSDANLQDLYAASHKLQIVELTMIIRNLMFEKVSPTTALNVLAFCDKFDIDNELKMKAFNEFGKNFPGKKIDPSYMNNIDKLKDLMKEKPKPVKCGKTRK